MLTVKQHAKQNMLPAKQHAKQKHATNNCDYHKMGSLFWDPNA